MFSSRALAPKMAGALSAGIRNGTVADSARQTLSASQQALHILKQYESRRPYISASTHKALSSRIPGLFDVNRKLPPYQPEGHCEPHAMAVGLSAQEGADTEALSSLWKPGGGGRLTADNDGIKHMMDKFQSKDVTSVEDFKSTYDRHGAFVFRGAGVATNGPGLRAGGYLDHAILVRAVVNAKVDGVNKTLLLAQDFSDEAMDEQTNDAWMQTWSKYGYEKGHVSTLSHDEAESVGAHLRNVRIVDAEGMLARTKVALDICNRESPESGVKPARIKYLEKDGVFLTAQGLMEISKIIETNPHEVERYQGGDPYKS